MNDFFNWTNEGDSGFLANITGNLDAAGNIWSGNAGSPQGTWRVNFATGCKVTRNVNLPDVYMYDIQMAKVAAVQNFGPALGFEIYCADFGLLSWGNRVPVPPPAYANPPYLPQCFGGGFKVLSAGQEVPGWSGSYTVTLMPAASCAPESDLTSWRYNIVLWVKGPAQ